MKVVRIESGGDYSMYLGSEEPIILKEGNGYVLSDPNARVFVDTNIMTRKIGSEDFGKYYKKYNGEDLSGKTLVAYRTGGAGDILFMTPGLKFLKNKYPDCELIVCTSKAYQDLVVDNPYIDQYHPIPADLDIFLKADYHILFERIIEDNPLAEYENAYDLYLNRMGLLDQFQEAYKGDDYLNNILPVVNVNEIKLEYVKDIMEEFSLRDEDVKVAIHLASTTPLRSYPVHHSLKLINLLAKSGIKVFLIGGRSDASFCDFLRNNTDEEYKNNIINFAYHSNSFGFTVALISLMNVVIGVDSSVLHIAGGLRIPLIGIYGPFHHRLRIGYYFKATGIMVKDMRCSPCFVHGPNPCPHAIEVTSPCLEIIRPEIILSELDNILENEGFGTREYGINLEKSEIIKNEEILGG